MEPEQRVAPVGATGLAATMFTDTGKIATLRRNEDGGGCVQFDDPLEGWRRDLFIDRRQSSRPIVIQERLAA